MKVDTESRRIVFDDFFKIEEAIPRYQRFDGTMSATARRLNFVRGDSVAAIVLNTYAEAQLGKASPELSSYPEPLEEVVRRSN